MAFGDCGDLEIGLGAFLGSLLSRIKSTKKAYNGAITKARFANFRAAGSRSPSPAAETTVRTDRASKLDARDDDVMQRG
jgi:hypothetical protein